MADLVVLKSDEFWQTVKESNGSSTPPPALPQPPNPFDAGGKISIDCGIDHLPTLNALSWLAIKKENNPPILFRFGNQMVRLTKNDMGGLWPQTVNLDILRHHLSNWAHWHKDNIRIVKPPKDVIADVLATNDIDLPILRRITNVPVFAPDGSLSLEPGYNPQSGVFYSPLPGFEALPVPDQVTVDDVISANKLICDEVLVDFPFASTSDRDNAVSLFLLPFARDLIDGPTPNHLIESPMPASGKGKLASALLAASVGNRLSLITGCRNDDEWDKSITTALMSGQQVVLIDNIIGRLDSGSLAAAWTGEIWDKRLLGTHTAANLPIRCVWVMTANNPAISTELTRRCIRIRITPQTDRPEERDSFRHPDIIAWCSEHRAELVRAAHVIIKWWLQKGRPAPTHGRALGSYERYAPIMGGILEAAGYKQFLSNYVEFQNAADTDRVMRAMFCSTWYNWAQIEPDKRKEVTAADLLPIAENIEGIRINGTTERGRVTSFGKWLHSNKDVYVQHSEETCDGFMSQTFRIVKKPIRNNLQWWSVELVEEKVQKSPG